MEFNFSIARHLLSMCEYHYRLGVMDSYKTSDAAEIHYISDKNDGYWTFQYVGEEEYDPEKRRALLIHIDHMIALSRKCTCDSLAGYLRLEKSDSLRRDICSIIDYHYRKGLSHGLQLHDIHKARDFFANYGRGTRHDHLLDYQKWDTMKYFDTVKSRVNKIHMARLEAGKPTSMNRISNMLLDVIVNKMKQLK